MGDTQYVKNPLCSPIEKPNTHGMEYKSLSKSLGVYISSDGKIEYGVRIDGDNEVFLDSKLYDNHYRFSSNNADVLITTSKNKRFLKLVKENDKEIRYYKMFKRKNEQFVSSVLKNGEEIFYYSKINKDTNEELVRLIKKNGEKIRFYDETFEGTNKQLVKLIEKNGKTVTYYNKTFEGMDKQYVRLVKKNGKIVIFYDKTFKRTDKQYVRSIEKNGKKIRFYDETFEDTNKQLIQGLINFITGVYKIYSLELDDNGNQSHISTHQLDAKMPHTIYYA